ncbi:MAG: SDR family oxidoreductase [Planctomycetes bacterium]|nr:SDR family oxidoreductase [Planctomycetota bacterium]
MPIRVSLVTGAGRGIGRAIALGLAKAGHRVAVAARTLDQLDDVAAEIRAGGGEALPIVADLLDRPSAARLVDRVNEQWGPIDILVNNAGVGSSQSPKPLVDFDDDFWDLTMAINVTAPYLLTKRVLPAMIERSWGRIINIASINAFIASMHGAAYTASKHAIAGLTKATAKEVAQHGITANAICPGVTRSKMNDLRLEYDAERLGTTFKELEQAASPLGRRLEPEEIAAAVVFLASDEARAINGQSIRVCGGVVT